MVGHEQVFLKEVKEGMKGVLLPKATVDVAELSQEPDDELLGMIQLCRRW